MRPKRADSAADRLMRGISIGGHDGQTNPDPKWLLDDIAVSAFRVSLNQVGHETPLVRFNSAAVGVACGVAESLIRQDPADLVKQCGSWEELVLMLACASRTLQFYCGGDQRNEYRWRLVEHAIDREPSLQQHHAAFIAFAAVESAREPSKSVREALVCSVCPSDIHASAHCDRDSEWRSQLDMVMPDLHVVSDDSRVRHLIAHLLLTGGVPDVDEALEIFRLHFTLPGAPGSPASILRDAVPVLLGFERSWGDRFVREMWPLVGELATEMGYGQEWTLTEACRIVALLRTGDRVSAHEVIDQIWIAATERPEAPGLRESAEALMLLVSGRRSDRLDLACLGGSREQFEFLQTVLTVG